MKKSLQETYAPKNSCFGCGPSNEKGLKIRSFSDGDKLVCDWTPEKHNEAFPGVINGGIIGALLDCHSNWTAAYHLMTKLKLESPPCTVTADYSVKLKAPTPSGQTLHLEAKPVESTDSKVIVEAHIECAGKIVATCRGTFVCVKPGHPAYHRW